MKILFLCKRRPQQRDLLERPYGRFHHLPAGLAALGHQVSVALVGHHGLAPTRREFSGVQWLAYDILGQGLRGMSVQLRQEAQSLAPDWVIGCSDAWCGWLAHRLAARCGARLAIDAYDNYESYMPWNKPLHWLWRRAVAEADLVTAAGPQLAGLLSASRRPGAHAHVLSMAPDPGFIPMDRLDCRHRLGLPLDAPLFGYSGGWAAKRGTPLLLQAFSQLRMELPEARLVLTGKPPPKALGSPGVLGLGHLPDEDMPAAINAMDVSCIVVSDGAFGRYSYPAKLYEAMACQTPVVASDTEPVQWILGGREAHLARCNDASAHASRMLAMYHDPRRDYPMLTDWPKLAQRLSRLLSDHS